MAGPDGTVFDLANDAGKQSLADTGALYWANTIARKIKEIDPQALVSAGMFSNLAVERSGFGNMCHDNTVDSRMPLRPLVLLGSDLDFIDIHSYAVPDYTFQQELDSIEWQKVKQQAAVLGKPVLLGEFGVFKHHYSDPQTALRVLGNHFQQTAEEGFVGHLLWTCDTHEQPEIWNAQDASGEFFRAMSE